MWVKAYLICKWALYENVLDIFPSFIKHYDLINRENNAGAGDLSGQVRAKFRRLSIIQDRPRQSQTHRVSPTWEKNRLVIIALITYYIGKINGIMLLPFLLWLSSVSAFSGASCCFCFSSRLISLASFLCFLASFTGIQEESLTFTKKKSSFLNNHCEYLNLNYLDRSTGPPIGYIYMTYLVMEAPSTVLTLMLMVWNFTVTWSVVLFYTVCTSAPGDPTL